VLSQGGRRPCGAFGYAYQLSYNTYICHPAQERLEGHRKEADAREALSREREALRGPLASQIQVGMLQGGCSTCERALPRGGCSTCEHA
jgi:hypothetical protein